MNYFKLFVGLLTKSILPFFSTVEQLSQFLRGFKSTILYINKHLGSDSTPQRIESTTDSNKINCKGENNCGFW